MEQMEKHQDEFELWDLRVEVCGDPRAMVCSHTPGEQSFSLYAMAAILTLLSAKQRMTPENDWMTTDAAIARVFIVNL